MRRRDTRWAVLAVAFEDEDLGFGGQLVEAPARGGVARVGDDVGERWRVEGASATRRPGATKEAELKATASELVLMLYRRLPVPDADVVGDPLLVASLLSLADTT